MKNILAFCFLSISLLAKSNEKKVWFSNSQLEIFSYKENCHDQLNGIQQEKVMFVFQNKTGNRLSVSFERQLWFDNRLAKQSPAESRFTILVEPNQTLQGNCTLKDKALVVYSKQLNLKGKELTNFTIENIQVITLQK
jgi:hypothetical protein